MYADVDVRSSRLPAQSVLTLKYYEIHVDLLSGIIFIWAFRPFSAILNEYCLFEILQQEEVNPSSRPAAMTSPPQLITQHLILQIAIPVSPHTLSPCQLPPPPSFSPPPSPPPPPPPPPRHRFTLDIPRLIGFLSRIITYMGPLVIALGLWNGMCKVADSIRVAGVNVHLHNQFEFRPQGKGDGKVDGAAKPWISWF